MPTTMRAIVLKGPGPVENLEMQNLPVLEPSSGWVRIRVKAFGLNRSELHTRLGFVSAVTFPRVIGIEATGVVDSTPGADLEPGQQVVTMMGGMGRTFDGGYAEYTVVPRSQVITFHSDLPWEVIGAISLPALRVLILFLLSVLNAFQCCSKMPQHLSAALYLP